MVLRNADERRSEVRAAPLVCMEQKHGSESGPPESPTPDGQLEPSGAIKLLGRRGMRPNKKNSIIKMRMQIGMKFVSLWPLSIKIGV